MNLRALPILAAVLAMLGSACLHGGDAPGAAAHWTFDGDLRDHSGHGHDAVGAGAEFPDGEAGKALQARGGPVEVPDSPDLRAAPGLRIDCFVRFDRPPAKAANIVFKDGEYMLRVNPTREGGDFAFFVNLDGWEPRVRTERRVKAGVWYRLMAAWDGSAMTLEVDGERARVGRSGLPRAGSAPLVMGGPAMCLDDVRIENPKRPALRVREVAHSHAILRAGRPEPFAAIIENVGAEADDVVAALQLPAGVTCTGELVGRLGTLATGAAQTVTWQLQAGRSLSADAGIRLTAAQAPPVTVRRTLVFFPPDDRQAAAAATQRPPSPGGEGAVSYYVDSLEGSNTNSGASPENAFRDFTKINGKTLGPGDKLLIRRGSVVNQELSVAAQGEADNWAQIGAYGSGCLIDHCTFENNAGAAIEVLGLKAPQTRNIEIAHSRFIRNNTAHKLGPAEIYIWGKRSDPGVCCSTGVIHDNGYTTVPGVEFFVNEAPKTTQWAVRDNAGYASVEALEEAMLFNRPPTVDAGPPIHTDSPAVRLQGRVADDGRPAAQPLKIRWEVLEGQSGVAFKQPVNAATVAEFPAPGRYLLRLVADDGELWRSDTVTVQVLPPGGRMLKAWDFDAPLDKEGWTEAHLGTTLQDWLDQPWPCRSYPVHYVAGGYYIVAVEDSKDAHLCSPADLGIDLSTANAVRLRFQNHTPATRMRLRFRTDADPAWLDGNSMSFEVVPNDTGSREYVVNMGAVPGWTGQLEQLQLDLATGTPLTGTCRIDAIAVCEFPGE